MTLNSRLTRSHANSYYASSANLHFDCERLKGENSADVCIVGAGFTGISAALHLAEKGYDVTVVEANKVGWGASGRNGGQMIGGISGENKLASSLDASGPSLIWDLRWAGHRIIRERVETYAIDCDLKHGYVDVAIKPRHLRSLEEEYRYLGEHKYPFEFRLLSKEQTQEMIGTEAYVGALLNMGNGHLHPLNLCLGEASAAMSLGAKIYEGSPVIRIERDKKATVVTDEGSVTAASIILAGNAYHFLEPSLRGNLLPVNSFIVASEPLCEKLIKEINPCDIAVCDPNYILTYFRLSGDGRLLFGGRFTYFGSDPEVIKQNLVPRLLKIYPQLEKTKFEFGWGGTIGVPINRVPQMGKLAKNIYYSQGYSGHGVNVTHLAGKLLSEAVAGTMERFDIFANIKPLTIPGQHLFRNQLVALGMIYYKLIDSL
ncbi:MAG: FAD-binding oxidoreductase [Cellvibrionales bacterium TMED148]|nr:FAD-dependent oxidoreductase [Porticoccaceae bacterium]RPG93023.1 MAG: FAD-binding oxidoreductase [Cellvibrionales bacterium TMED148]